MPASHGGLMKSEGRERTRSSAHTQKHTIMDSKAKRLILKQYDQPELVEHNYKAKVLQENDGFKRKTQKMLHGCRRVCESL